MRQPEPSPVERRREPRAPKAFAFWFRAECSATRTSAWMLDVSTEGAAILTAAAEVPPVGQRVELLEMPARDRLVREDSAPPARFARVLRHDDVEGLTRRVALKFESDVRTPRTQPDQRLASASLDRSRVAPPPPPTPPTAPDANRCWTGSPREV